jgi:hypothetical protein
MSWIVKQILCYNLPVVVVQNTSTKYVAILKNFLHYLSLKVMHEVS